MPDDQIEAKLAAYVDGQLPPEDVADLERHLAANSGQRRVVEQMMQARKWVATLPRVRAPADLLEAIDPSLERSALFAESNVPSRWSTLLSPQVLALAATVALVVTLLAAMVWLVPDRGGTEPIATNPPEGTSDNPDLVGQDEPIGPQLPTPDDSVADRGTGTPIPEVPPNDRPVNDEGTGVQPSEPVIPVLRLPPGLTDPVILSANVPSIPQASGAVSQFLTANELPFGVQWLPVEGLPDDVRHRLELAEGGSVFVYVVEEMSLEQVGALTGELTDEGEAHALTPAGFAARHGGAPPIDQPEVAPPNGDQAKVIYAEDLLSLQIQRLDEPPESTPPGMPQIGKEKQVQVPVSADGYADFREIGLGRIDVLGKLPADLAQEIKATLSRSFQIEADVTAAVATASSPEGGRTRETVQLIYLDREPLAAGDVVQIELPDGSWLHTAVDELGMLDAGPWGQIKAAGESAVAVQARLRERAGEGVDPATRETAPIRVVNLTARRAEGVDEWGQTRVACVIVIHAPAQEGDDPWAPLTDKPATQPSTQPTTRATTQPAPSSN